MDADRAPNRLDQLQTAIEAEGGVWNGRRALTAYQALGFDCTIQRARVNLSRVAERSNGLLVRVEGKRWTYATRPPNRPVTWELRRACVIISRMVAVRDGGIGFMGFRIDAGFRIDLGHGAVSPPWQMYRDGVLYQECYYKDGGVHLVRHGR